MYQELSDGFVEERPPYVLTHDNATQSALKGELTFDAGRFVTDTVSSSSTPSTPTPQHKEDHSSEGVPIADLLGDIDFTSTHTPVVKTTPSVLLKLDATISPSDFQQKWFNLRVV
jgi:hypothetical protein